MGENKNLVSVFFFLSAAEALITIIYLILIPGDPKNSLILGFSLSRLGMLAVMLGAFTWMFWSGIWSRRNPVRLQKWFDKIFGSHFSYSAVIGIACFLVLAGWGLSWMPGYRIGSYAAYLDRSRPLIAWFTLTILQALILLMAIREKKHDPQSEDHQKQIPFSRRAFFTSLISILLVFCYVCFTRTGLKPDVMFWNEPGIPLLGLQIIAVCGILFLAITLPGKNLHGRREIYRDIFLFFLIWAVAAVVLTGSPAQRTYFSPGPYPPNNEVYPFSDAAGYDISAQYALVGQGFGNSHEVDKPLLSFFLFLLHLASGENYNRIITLQAALLAIFPSILYLLGKRLFRFEAGLAIAILVIFKEINAYGAGIYIQVSHSKLFLGEIPLAIVLALFTFFVVRWFRGRSGSLVAAMAAGGLLGLATLLRHNPWLLVPVILLSAAVRFRREWKMGLKSGLMFLIVFGIAITPWILRTVSLQDNPLYFLGPLQGVVWNGRYLPAVQTTSPAPLPTNDQNKTPAVGTTAQKPANAIPTIDKVDRTITPYPSETPFPPIEGNGFNRLGIITNFVSSHLLHNLAASVLILPHRLVMDDLQHTLKGAGAVWLPGWAGYMGTLDTFLILISLAFTALGIGAAWKKIGPAGIMPLVIFLGYNLATAIARTSGGRYLVPVDWVVILYFGIGLALSIRWVTGALGFSREDQITKDEAPQLVPTRLPWKGGFMVAACFLLIGGAIPFAEKIVTPMYTINKLDQTLEQVQLEKLLEPYGVGEKDLQDYLKSEKRIIGYGRLLYPRFYRANEGEPDIYSANKGLPFPRLIFNVVGGKSGSFVLPLSEVPGPLTPGSSVLVLGCSKSRWYADALQLIILGPEPKVLTRSPAATLTCPVEQPICDNNGNCQ